VVSSVLLFHVTTKRHNGHRHGGEGSVSKSTDKSAMLRKRVIETAIEKEAWVVSGELCNTSLRGLQVPDRKVNDRLLREKSATAMDLDRGS
jgi:hypothetical protein